MKILTALPLLLLCTTAIAGTVRDDPVSDVRCHEIGFSKSVEEGNLARFRSYLDDDTRFVGQSVLRGHEAVTAAWRVFFDANGPIIKWRPQFVEVLKDGQLALTRGPYRVIVTDEDGNTTENWGTFNSVWRAQPDGGWKVVFDAGSPASQAPAEEIKALLDQADACAEESSVN